MATLVGVVAFAASIVLLVDKLGGITAEVRDHEFGSREITRLVGVLPIYVVAVGLVHLGWGMLVNSTLPLHERDLTRAIAVSCRAQVAKYLPGNFAHLAGRQLLVSRLGWSQSAAAGASLVEVVGLPAVAVAVAVAGTPLAGDAVGQVGVPRGTLLLVTAGLLIAVALATKVRWLAPLVARLREFSAFRWKLFGCYLGFFVLSGTAQALLLPEFGFVKVLVASAVAWVVGYLAPGLPAGLGVREATLVLVLGLEAADVALAVLTFRVVMVLADLGLFAGGVLIERRRSRLGQAVSRPV